MDAYGGFSQKFIDEMSKSAKYGMNMFKRIEDFFEQEKLYRKIQNYDNGIYKFVLPPDFVASVYKKSVMLAIENQLVDKCNFRYSTYSNPDIGHFTYLNNKNEVCNYDTCTQIVFRLI